MNSTVFLTVLSGVITYVLGQLVLRLVIEPVQELRRTISVISHALIRSARHIRTVPVRRGARAIRRGEPRSAAVVVPASGRQDGNRTAPSYRKRAMRGILIVAL